MSENESLLPVKGSLEDDERASGCESQEDSTHRPKSRGLVRQSLFIVLNTVSVLFFLLNLTIFLAGWRDVGKLKESYSPVRGDLSFMLKSEHATDHSVYSKYSGYPSDDNNKAWEDLIQPTFFRTSREALAQAGDTVENSVKIADGGYLAALGVYHEIHCLRQLRLFLYSEVYYPNLTAGNIEYLQGHLGNYFPTNGFMFDEVDLDVDHCLETLRISVMCSADTSLYTFFWNTTYADRPLPKSSSNRKCVDWEGLESWADARKVPLNPVLLRTTGEADRIHLK